jgi:hypothetical protein
MVMTPCVDSGDNYVSNFGKFEFWEIIMAFFPFRLSVRDFRFC